jgi:hypothetical protein
LCKPKTPLQRSQQRSAHINISLADSTYHWILLLLLLLLLLHTRRRTHAQCNHVYCCKWVRRWSSSIAFGETLLAALTRDEWVLTSWCQERRPSWIGPLKEYLVDGRPVERTGDMSCLSYACKGRKDGWTDNELVLVCLVIYACEERKDGHRCP